MVPGMPPAIPKISIVIPVYNAGTFLDSCLASALNQTLPDIEIICVDDASTDGSAHRCAEQARLDSRVRLIRHPQNLGTFQARKDGVLAATGEYILFLDGDDTLDRQACASLYGEMQRDRVDILHFPAAVINVDDAPEEQIRVLSDFVRPHTGRLEGQEVFEGCFLHNKYRYTLWNKMMESGLCKQGYLRMAGGRLSLSEDLCAFFAIAFLAKSYRGVAEPVLYHYRFGAGLNGRKHYSFDLFIRQCEQATAAHSIHAFLMEAGALDRYSAVYEKIRSRLCDAGAWCLHEMLPVEERARGYDLLVDHWGVGEAVSALAKYGWTRPQAVAQSVRNAVRLTRPRRPVKTLGVYYHRLAYGGVERTISMLIPLWLSQGHRVVLFTDLPPSENDYPIPREVVRIVLPAWEKATAENYRERAASWETALREQSVDAVAYQAWVCPLLLWDLLTIKSSGVGFVVNTRSVFSYLLTIPDDYFVALPALYALADAVVCTSRVDRRFWGMFAPRAHYLPNPLVFDLARTAPSALDGQVILWVGRLSGEKNALDAVRIMEQVVKHLPHAQLRMLGRADDEAHRAELEQEIVRSGLSGRVILYGHHQDLSAQYQEAAVLLSTSRYEGYANWLAEGMAHGLPCVMYELPYLELVRAGGGILPVPQGDVAGAARKIIYILQHEQERKRMGREARTVVADMATFDLTAGWRRVWECLSEDPASAGAIASEPETDRLMLETLTAHLAMGMARLKAVDKPYSMFWQDQLKRESAAYERQLEATRNYLNRELARKRELAGERDSLRRELAALRRSQSEQEKQRTAAQQSLRRELKVARQQLAAVRKSPTYRLGGLMMWLPTRVFQVLKRLRPRGGAA